MGRLRRDGSAEEGWWETVGQLSRRDGARRSPGTARLRGEVCLCGGLHGMEQLALSVNCWRWHKLQAVNY